MLFVTALFLPEAPGPLYRSLQQYLAHFRPLLAAGVRLRVYTSPQLALVLQLDWEGLPTGHVELRVDVPMERYHETSPVLPMGRSPLKDTAFYLSMQLSKLKFCADAALTEPWLAWIDFGVFHMLGDAPAAQAALRLLAHLLPTSGLTRLLSPQGRAGRPPELLWDWPCWHHLGSVLFGPASAFLRAHERQRDLVEAHLPRLTWEINYWAMLPEDFEGYAADHDDSILAAAPPALAALRANVSPAAAGAGRDELGLYLLREADATGHGPREAPARPLRAGVSGSVSARARAHASSKASRASSAAASQASKRRRSCASGGSLTQS